MRTAISPPVRWMLVAAAGVGLALALARPVPPARPDPTAVIVRSVPVLLRSVPAAEPRPVPEVPPEPPRCCACAMRDQADAEQRLRAAEQAQRRAQRRLARSRAEAARRGAHDRPHTTQRSHGLARD